MAILDDGEAAEEVAALGIGVDARQLAIEPRGVALVGVMLVPVIVHVRSSVLR
jgi:hypothetical protein